MSLSFDVFWSFRSPYCYLTLDRFAALQRDDDVTCVVRPTYPMAVRDPNFFKSVNPKYRRYHTMDFPRVAEFLGMPCRRPVPDPIVMDMATNAIAPEQPYIRHVTRLCALAQTQGKSFDFVNSVMRMMWDGTTDNWHEGNHIKDAMTQAGLDADQLLKAVEKSPDRAEAIIEANHAVMAASDHWGLPLMIFDGETFYGQDRVDLLIWRLKQKGAQPNA